MLYTATLFLCIWTVDIVFLPMSSIGIRVIDNSDNRPLHLGFNGFQTNDNLMTDFIV